MEGVYSIDSTTGCHPGGGYLNGIARFLHSTANNSNGLIKNVADQAIQRQANLPAGMEQQVVIDVRGQTITEQQEFAIRKGIVSKSNGIIRPDMITFKTR